MSKKSPAIENMLKVVNPSRGTGLCICGSDKTKPEDFRDDISRKEYAISQLCQNCQDSVFNPSKTEKTEEEEERMLEEHRKLCADPNCGCNYY